jgi:serine-type D-Ala-D-Ala carboxypeptidase/endopeptidase (penicillin-binding protein 4)
MRYGFKGVIIINYLLIIITGCSVQKQIGRSAKKNIINDSSFLAAHTGISIYDPSTSKYLYNYQGDKYFVPASNTKIPTCYAAMKYLGDSLVGLRYIKTDPQNVYLIPTGDPTFLHADFNRQPVYELLKTFEGVTLTLNNWRENGLGNGWAWNDYNDSYEAERSAFPIYGNCLSFTRHNEILKVSPSKGLKFDAYISKGVIPWDNFNIRRFKNENSYQLKNSENRFSSQTVPFIPNDSIVLIMLEDTLKNLHFKGAFNVLGINGINNSMPEVVNTIHSQPTDSLLKPMMHRSDNFFAEQTLLMVSNERLGIMNDEKIIDTILKTKMG